MKVNQTLLGQIVSPPVIENAGQDLDTWILGEYCLDMAYFVFSLVFICFTQSSDAKHSNNKERLYWNFDELCNKNIWNWFKLFKSFFLFCFDILFVSIINVEVKCCCLSRRKKMSLQFVASLTNKSRNWFNKKTFISCSEKQTIIVVVVWEAAGVLCSLRMYLMSELQIWTSLICLNIPYGNSQNFLRFS